MAVTEYLGTNYAGLSTDTKPTTGVNPGSIFTEMDTRRYFVWTGETWAEKVAGDGGLEQHGNEYHTPDMALQTDFAAHAARHRHGGADEVATATPGADVIPKAGADGKLASGFIPGGASGGVNTLKKTADQVINGTAFRDISDLTFPVSPNTDYAFDFYIVFRSVTTTTGFRFAINGPAGAVCDYFMTYQTVANSTTAGVATWLQGHWVVYDTMTALTSTIAAGVDLVCMIKGRIKVAGTGGTLAARVASELANNDLVVQKGSWGIWF